MSVVDIFAALDNRHIIISCNNLEEGWFFFDSDAPDDAEFRGGDGMFYELPADAAYAASEFYGLLNDDGWCRPTNETESRTVKLSDSQVDLILMELRESNSADWFVIHNEGLDEEDIADLEESMARRNEVISILVASQL